MKDLACCAFGFLVACQPPDHQLQPLAGESEAFHEQLAPLARAIGDSRIVLLGENGHGVGQFTELKARLVEWLHQDMGFEVIAMESGFFECGHVASRLAELTPKEALYQCLSYPFQHAEVLPLFEYLQEHQRSDVPFILAGVDIQAQGFDSGNRPTILYEILLPLDPGLAASIARIDTGLFLVQQAGGLGPDLYRWAYEHADSVAALYDSAAALTDGWARWVFRLTGGWIERLAVRGRAEAEGAEERPARYYEVRDEWMARAVAALADSIAGSRKVVVWLHNDHARYGAFAAGSSAIPAAGQYLREWYGQSVFSVGFFLGRGTIADNGRNERVVAGQDSGGVEAYLSGAGTRSSYLILRDNTRSDVVRWAGDSVPYLRMGIDPRVMVPALEFDALVYVDSVGPPTYEIR